MRGITAALCGLLAALPAAAAPPAPSVPADATLRAILADEWAFRGREGLTGLDEDGPAIGPHLPHVDPASQARRQAYWAALRHRLDAVPLARLSPEARVDADVLGAVLDGFLVGQRFREWQDPFGFWTWLAPQGPFGRAADYRAYLSRLREMPRYVDEQLANLRAGAARGFTHPRVSLGERWRPVAPLASADMGRNPLWTPFAQMPVSVAGPERDALLAQGRAAVAAAAPAWGRLLAYLRDDYIPHARTATAAEALPDGRAYYAAKVRQYTTTDLTPEAIHAQGEQEVARIDADMRATMRSAGWTGDFQGFLKFLKTDPRFYAKTPYELVAKSTYVANRINGQLQYAFGLLPRYRFTIVPTPAAIAPFATGGNGGMTNCLMNTYDLPARPLYTIPPLTAHECVPGHSFQAALALEAPSRPPLRRTTYFSGYGEGWALYMEWLGQKMGIYETPYDEFGRETYEMWRAARLVVDTGLHHGGWSRERALDFLKAHTALSDHEVTIEVDRYINDPGQALAYKLGELTIRRERAKAEARLGARFDQRWFHDTILGLGAVPLPTLERVLDAWIAAGGPEPAATKAALADH